MRTQAWLATIAVANTVVSLFYYLRVIGPTVLDRGDETALPPTTTAASLSAALALGTIATVALGLIAEAIAPR